MFVLHSVYLICVRRIPDTRQCGP